MSTGEYVTTVALIALAMTAIVPLALRRPPSMLDTLSAALAVASFAGPPSLAAAVLTAPWIATTGVHVGRTRTLPGLWVLAAGGWLAMHRSGVDPLAVGDGIALLTVAHFLVAGCGLTALMIEVADRRDRGIGPVVVHQLGMVSVAIGILVGGWFEPIGAAAIIGALAVHSARAWRLPLPRRRWILRVSALAWTSPMVLAMLWALRMHLPQPVVGSIATMLAHHGSVNAIAVVLAGLLAVAPDAGQHRRTATERFAMPTLHRPTPDAIARRTAAWSDRELSYPVGLLDRPDDQRRWFLDHLDTVVGRGRDDFAAAADSIRTWAKFRQPWTAPAEPLAPIEVGAMAGYTVRVLGVWWVYCCRIVEVIDETVDGVERFGFVYGTVRGHAECGEERFLVTHDLSSGEVRFAITAVSRPGRWFTWCGLPIARLAQARFRTGATAVVAEHVATARTAGGVSSAR